MEAKATLAIEGVVSLKRDSLPRRGDSQVGSPASAAEV